MSASSEDGNLKQEQEQRLFDALQFRAPKRGPHERNFASGMVRSRPKWQLDAKVLLAEVAIAATMALLNLRRIGRNGSRLLEAF